jgi:hypothetical protein
LQVLPDLGREQHAGLQPAEREHRRGRLPVDPQPGQQPVQVVDGHLAQVTLADPKLVEVLPGDEAVAVRRAERVADVKILGEVFQHVVRAIAGVVGRHQQR